MVERHVANVRVASSNLVSRSSFKPRATFPGFFDFIYDHMEVLGTVDSGAETESNDSRILGQTPSVYLKNG